MKSSEKVMSVIFVTWAWAGPAKRTMPPSNSQVKQRLVLRMWVSFQTFLAASLPRVATGLRVRGPLIAGRDAMLDDHPGQVHRGVRNEVEQGRDDALRLADADRAAIMIALRLGADIHEQRRCTHSRG